MSVRQVVILVGGKGERLNDGFRYTPVEAVPKPLVEVGGKPFLTYAINTFKGLGIIDIVLLVLHKKEYFEFLADGVVRLVDSQEDVDKAVLGIPSLQSMFVLLNGDCYPVIANWSEYLGGKSPKVAVKINTRDAGIATVLKSDVESGKVHCGHILDMLKIYPNFTILGGLHVGTYQGLERARQFMDLVCFGQ